MAEENKQAEPQKTEKYIQLVSKLIRLYKSQDLTRIVPVLIAVSGLIFWPLTVPKSKQEEYIQAKYKIESLQKKSGINILEEQISDSIGLSKFLDENPSLRHNFPNLEMAVGERNRTIKGEIDVIKNQPDYQMQYQASEKTMENYENYTTRRMVYSTFVSMGLGLLALGLVTRAYKREEKTIEDEMKELEKKKTQ